MKNIWKKGLALGLSFFMAIELPFSFSLPFLSSYGAERAASVKATTLNVRSGPGTGNSIVAKLSYGAAVTVLGETYGSDGALWYQIRFTGSGGSAATGYVSASYIKFPASYNSDGNFETYLDSQGFPESYRPALRELHAKYPQWQFTALNTNLDWNTVIQNESLVGRNLVSSSSISSWKSVADGAYDWGTSTWPGFDGSSWVAASEDIIRYYMDPRNFLNETYIFQFLVQTYDSSIHTREGLTALVQGTFLENRIAVSDSYAGSGVQESSGGSSTVSGAASGTSSGTVSSGSSSSEISYGPGWTSSSNEGQTSGTGDSNVSIGVAPGGSVSGTSGSENGGTGSAAPGNGGNTSGSSSGVWVGYAPGVNISLAVPEIGISRHEADRVAATAVIRMGPGEESSSSGSSSYSSGSGSAGLSGRTAPYVDVLMKAAEESGVNPYVLAAMILQEQGSQGNTASISGAGGYYNYYNFEAYASNGMTAVERGLWYASQSGSYMRPWNSPDKAIIGGACQYGQNYLQAGQNTFYLKKFNVQGDNLYKHQYMTNVEGAASEGARMGEAYSESMRQNVMHFMIPVYQNMPQEACQRPVGDGSPNNKLSLISVDGFTLNPGFNRDTNTYDVSVNSSVSSVELRAAAIDSTARVSGAGTVTLTGTVTEARIQVTAQNGSVREYVIRINRSDSGPASNGTAGQSSSGAANYGPGGNTGTTSGTGTSGGTGASGNGPGSSGSGSSGSSTLTGPGGSNVTIIY